MSYTSMAHGVKCRKMTVKLREWIYKGGFIQIKKIRSDIFVCETSVSVGKILEKYNTL